MTPNLYNCMQYLIPDLFIYLFTLEKTASRITDVIATDRIFWDKFI